MAWKNIFKIYIFSSVTTY